MKAELRTLYLAFVNAAALVILNEQVAESFRHELQRYKFELVCKLLRLSPEEYLQTQVAPNEMAALSVYRLGLMLADLLESEYVPDKVYLSLTDLSSTIEWALDPPAVAGEGARLRGAIHALFQLHIAPGYVPQNNPIERKSLQ
jgi:hypothetical protein